MGNTPVTTFNDLTQDEISFDYLDDDRYFVFLNEMKRLERDIIENTCTESDIKLYKELYKELLMNFNGKSNRKRSTNKRSRKNIKKAKYDEQQLIQQKIEQDNKDQQIKEAKIQESQNRYKINNQIECPLCRIVSKNFALKIFCSIECKICYVENDENVVLNCRHCFCNHCCDKLDKPI